jgi:hypothetical protein
MKKIISILVFSIIFVFSSCQNCKNRVDDINKIDKIQIKSVDFSIMTIISVECDKFEEYFENYQTVSIVSPNIIRELLTFINELKPIDSTYSKEIDTRAKITLYSKKDIISICMGNLTMRMNNNIYKTPNKLINLIEQIQKINKLNMQLITLNPLAEKYYSFSLYAYCEDNPIMRIDPDGLEWFYYSVDGKADPTWIWHEGHSYNTGVKDSNGKEVVLQGQEAVVIFNGSTDEKLGEGQNMYAKDAKLADVIVYGPGGEDDIQHYKGYTMSSDPTKFGVVANGD